MLRFGASKGFLCRKITYHLMENREEDWKETVKKRQNKIEAWRLSCLSIEELLCLQLLGYSPRQLYEDIESEKYSLQETASMSVRELDKAKRILDRQAKAGCSPSLTMTKRILTTSAIYAEMHRRSSTCWEIRIYSTVRIM